MNAPRCLCLPLLRGPLPATGDHSRSDPVWPHAMRLWPGLPRGAESDGLDCTRYCPPDYPLTPDMANALLEELRAMTARELADQRQVVHRETPVHAARLCDELAHVAALGNGDDSGDGDGPAAASGNGTYVQLNRVRAEQAQKILLWAWLQEERLAELAALADQFADSASRLRHLLDESSTAIRVAGTDSRLAVDSSLLPPWPVVVASACRFLPPDLPLALEGPMREALLERLEFQPDAHWTRMMSSRSAHGPCHVLIAHAPLWLALGHSRPQQDTCHADSAVLRAILAERTWLAWSGA